MLNLLHRAFPQPFSLSSRCRRALHRIAVPSNVPCAWQFSAAGLVVAGLGAASSSHCEVGIGDKTQLPPRPAHHILRPDVDPRLDGSMMIRFDPPEQLRSGAAIIILPGGNYEQLSLKEEGHQVAVWLSNLGITAIVLKYRLIPEGHYWPAQLEDLELAMRTVRTNATAWRIDRKRVGVLGFSAGGHLAGAAAVCKDASVRPDAQILVYPTIDVSKPDWWPWKAKEGFPPPEESVHLHVCSDVPPAFLAVSTEDRICTAEDNTEPYATRLQAAGVAVEHFVKAMGKHGHGLKGGWTEPCEHWLKRLGWTCNTS